MKSLSFLTMFFFTPNLFAGYELLRFQDIRKEPHFSLGAIADCVKGPSETPPAYAASCIKLTSIRLGFEQQYSDSAGAILTLSPLIIRNETLKDSPLGIPHQPDPLVVVESFFFLYSFFPSVEMSLETYQGFRFYPDTSGLPLASRFYDRGWDQLALSIDGRLSAIDLLSFRVSLGNGEGELLSNANQEGFFAFEAAAQVLPSLYLVGGLSFNQNNAGSLGYFDDKKALFQECGVIRSQALVGSRRLSAI